jgi:hypothetical protein
LPVIRIYIPFSFLYKCCLDSTRKVRPCCVMYHEGHTSTI